MTTALDTARHVPDLLRANAAAHPERVALRFRRDDGWETIDWKTYAARVERLAAGLVQLGIEPGDRVAVLSGNRPEWHVADLAILSAGAVTIPCYPTSSSSQVVYLLRNSGARAVFVENSEQLNKVLLRRDELPDVRAVVLFDPNQGLDGDFVRSIDELGDDGGRCLVSQPDIVAGRVAGIDPTGLATLVYTSGTTGPPKGAMITHANVLWTLRSVLQLVDAGPDDRFLSFLPLSHIAERMVSHFYQLATGAETWFARSLATVPEDLQACRPTLFFAVPRVWEKLMDAINGRIAAQPGPLRAVLQEYETLGRVAAGEDEHALAGWRRYAYPVLDHTVGRSVRKALGLDQARVLVSSAAPIHPDRLRWFAGIGLHIAEVWGQTEDCGPATMNPPDAIRLGTVGKALPGVELRIAADGEVLVRAGSVCAGYFGDPEATAKLIDADGWMATGDLGELDADGYLRITGRKKDLIILSSGKNIAPQEIETHLEMQPLIAKSVVVGEGRPYLVALLTLDAETLAEWAHHQNKIGATEALLRDRDLLAAIGDEVEAVNERLSRVEGIKKWRILPQEFTVAGGELTPTLKVKRNVVIERNAELIEELYAS